MTSLRKILVPTDFSRNSTYALRAAAALAHDNGASLVVLHVELLRSDHPETGSKAETAYHRDLEREFGRFCEAVSGVRVERKTARGEPAAEIVGAADELDCDLIAMGTHGRTGLARLLAGSVTEEVLRRSAVPVLAVRSPSSAFRSGGGPYQATADLASAPRPSAVRTILAPVDVSRQSRQTAQVAASLARAYQAKLILLNVQEWDQLIWSDGAAAGYDAEVALRVHARRRMLKFHGELNGVDHEWRTARGRPVEEILKAADAMDCDLIVMHTHGPKGWERLLFGSVAEGVMRKANCPVLILRQPAAFATEDRKHGPEPTSHDAKVPACQGPSPTNARHERIAVSSHVSCPGGAGGQAHHGAYPEVVEETAAIEGAFLDARQHRGPLDCPRRPASAPPRRGAPEPDRGGLTPAGPVRPATQSYVPTHDSLSMM